MSQNGNVDTAELAKFEAMAQRWWDPAGEFRPLHDLNPTRIDYIDARAGLAGRRVLDVGCGGGLVAEAMAQRGADVTGIDMARGPLDVAKLHAMESGVKVDYRLASAEQLADESPASFDVVTCLEMLEHVPRPSEVVAALARLVRPGGHVICSTINRGPKAFMLAIVGAALARLWMTHESIGAPPTTGQIVAHLFLLHDLFDYEALSAGIWYIAIDFQLYALFVLLLWSTGLLFGRSASADFAGIAVVAFVALASLFFFNLHPGWDATALYFFGAYALGAGSAWAVRSVHPHLGLALLALLGILALSFDFRPRIAIALVVAVILGLSHLHLRLNGSHVLSLLSRSSYALFLVHFPICLVVNALFNAWAPDHPGLNALGVLVAWIASNAVALMFYQHVEIRLASAFSRWSAGRFAH
mgnify:CR=1 FL=1